MKKTLAIVLTLVFAFCLCATAMAADAYTVTVVNGTEDAVVAEVELAAGEDLVIVISCSAPTDMGAPADGEDGAGVVTTDGAIAYSDITTGGPHAYPTAETVTITGIASDATVTITPNPDEAGDFPALTINGESYGAAASGEASGEASSEEPYPMFEEYKAYLLETLLLDEFWQGNEATLRADLDAAETPDAECIQNFTGSGDVDQAPAGVVFPMTYDAWYAANAGEAAGSVEEAYVEYIHEWLLAELEVNSNMTIEQIEDEFMPLIEAGNYTDFPAEMLYGGMLENGVAMTFEEFAAQY